jgi:hypothetical protein
MNRSDDRSDDRAPDKAPSSAPQKQQQQQGAGGDKQHGEGNYQATRDYDRGVKEHLRTHDVEREARDAAPRSPEEAREMQQAEDLGKKKAQGMRDSKDRMDRTDADTEGDVK